MNFNITRNKEIHQAHVVIGCRTMAGTHPDRYAMHLLNNILGGPAMTARLNMALREHAGLVYTVESVYTPYPDAGLWEVYFGCDPDDVGRCQHLVEQELQRLITTPLTSAQLRAAKKQYKGQIGISRSNRENYAVSMGKTYAVYGYVTPLEETFRRIDAVTSADIQRVAGEWLVPAQLSVLKYMPC